jgi:poly-gamma-glutamate synthesis protein (capsule biosynthesis protein)
VEFQASLVLPADMSLAESPEQANARLEFNYQSPVSRWIYALVTPFPSLVDSISADTLRRAWSGEATGPFSGKPLLMDESSLYALHTLWGEPAPSAVQVLPADQILSHAWKNQPSWAIVPFEKLEPRWKALEIDGQSPLRKDFEAGAYLLNVPISLTTAPTLTNPTDLPIAAPSNRQPERLTVLSMTGVTALVRSTAYAMERKGVEYPAGAILSWLKDADLTHVSNEVPFAEDCPAPDPFQAGMTFCSKPGYIGLLEAIGTDIVELTGDHFQDWGPAAMNLTLDMYQERGWLFYGGGANIDQARQAITLEHHGNRLAWIGCNAKGGGYAQASAKRPGAAACDYDWMESEISRLRNEGYLPIATFQHFEYYTYQAQPDQKRDFRRMAQAGAVIVSGSQAHQPQAIEFNQDAFIHYGLGNLFFDQFEVSLATRQAFVDRHVFYNGRYIGVELLTGMFIDYAKMRPMTTAERNTLLQSIFNANDW